MALTDEDTSEYRTFEMITTMVPSYKQRKEMLCTVHAIWKYFKEHIRPTLPKQGMVLSEIGKKYGENETVRCFQQLTAFQTHNFYIHFLQSGLVLQWIMRQCNEHEKVSKYQRSCNDLKFSCEMTDRYVI